MDELEISKTLKPLTSKKAAAYVKQQKADMGKTAVSIYLFIAQDGLKQTNLTFQRYCEEIGMEERTVRNWIARVKATMIVNDINDIVLVDQYELSEFNTPLVPQVAALEICRIEPEQAREAWREWSAIREEPTLANRGNAASFRRIVDRKFPKAESEYYSDSQDQKQPETVNFPPVETAPNTQYKGPWCECGEPMFKGQKTCDDCRQKSQKLVADPPPNMAELMDHIAGEHAAGPVPDVPEVEEEYTQADMDREVAQAEHEIAFSLPPMKSISVLTVCSAVKTDNYPEVWTLRLTDGNGHEHTALLSQKVLDLAPIK